MNESVLNTDAFDRRRFEQLFEMSEKMRQVELKGRQVLPSFRPLMSDMWAGLFKMKPELQEDIKPELQINHKLMQRVMEDEAYQDFREFTRLDDLSSAIGSMKYSDTVLKWLGEQADKDNTLRNALSKARRGDQKALDEAGQLLSDALDQNDSSLSNMLQQAAKETVETKDSLKALLGGIQPGSGEGELKKVPLRDQLALAEKISADKKLKEIATWAGRMKVIAQRKQRNKHKESIDRSGVTQGDTVEKLLPSELAVYTSPMTKMDFLRRFVEGQTLQYDTKGNEPLGKGPIILCLDQSGSMRGQDTISKGFALALMGIARKQRRDFALILFDGQARSPQIFERGKISVGDMVDLAKIFLDGGTNFESPLKEAAAVIEKSRFNKSDIIFVTDGEDRLTDDFIGSWNDLKKKKEFQVLTLLLGTENDSTVRQFSDRVVKVSSFMDSAISEAFEI